MIAIVDYGVGNLFSLTNSLNYIGAKSFVTGDPKEIAAADGVILPGVGAFAYAYNKLVQNGLVETLQNLQTPLFGICLGCQMLFSKSYEFGECEGLNLINGEIHLIKTEYKIPHIGFNQLHKNFDSPINRNVNEGDYVYFVHSYKILTDKANIACFSDYGTEIPALISHGNVYGAQFHPEKSGEVGMQILKNFSDLCV